MINFLLLFLSLKSVTICQKLGGASIIYQWTSVDYDWPSPAIKEECLKNGSFIVENNIITGIKVYKGNVYVTVPRWRPGVPSSMNVVVEKNGEHLLKPFPSWSMQRLDDCSAIQYSQSMEIDPGTGWMWIIDAGNSMASASRIICRPKLMIYDIEGKKIIRTHHFPTDVVSSPTLLNDIVLQRIGGKAVVAYITDSHAAKMVVYDFRSDTSFSYFHITMIPEPGATSIIHIDHKAYRKQVAIDGIAMSPDFRYVFYCPLGGTNLYRIPTSVISRPNGRFSESLKMVGVKKSQSDGLMFGKKNLYYGALSENAVYKWDYVKDLKSVASVDDVTMTTQVQMAHDGFRMKWVDTFGFDEDGFLWFTSNNLVRFTARTMNFSQSAEANMYIWKMFVNEKGYLNDGTA